MILQMSEFPITIAVPVFNRAEIVGRTLDSIHAQTFRPLKLILVDNNSTDNTLAVLRKWKAEHEAPDFVVTILQEEKPGAPNARNAALAAVDTEWTMFFDSDDTMPADHVEKALGAAVLKPVADIVGWSRRLHFLDGKKQMKSFALKNLNYENLTRSIFATQSYMAKTALFRRAGGWDPEIRVGQDIELGSRLLALKPVATAVPNHCVDVLYSEVSITNSTSNHMSAMQHTLEKIRETLPEKHRHWVDLQLIIKAASEWGRTDADSPRIIEEALARTSPRRRWLFSLLHKYQRHNGRGTARIYALLHANRME